MDNCTIHTYCIAYTVLTRIYEDRQENIEAFTAADALTQFEVKQKASGQWYKILSISPVRPEIEPLYCGKPISQLTDEERAEMRSAAMNRLRAAALILDPSEATGA